MKKIFLVLLCGALLLTSGCAFARERRFKTGIIFNQEPFTRETAGNYSRNFQRGEKIYWLFMSKKPIKANFIKVQVVSSSHKYGFLTITGYAYTHDYKIDKDTPYYFTDYLVMHTPGHYYMEIFDRADLIRPLAIADFYVK